MRINNLIKIADTIFLIKNIAFEAFSLFLETTSSIYNSTISIHQDFVQNFGIEKIPSTSESIIWDSQCGDIAYSRNNWNDSEIYFSKSPNPDEAILLAVIYSRLSFENVLLCHVSLIDYQGHGILFVGPSGIGKTTQAELWNKYRNADIINGDKAFIKVEGNEVRGYGLPWKGSSPYCLNADVKLDGVVVLRQAKENKIRELSFEEKLQLFVPHIFLPVWDESCMSAAMNTLDMLVPQIPVYLLECRPDEAAVELTEKTVLKNI